MRRTKPNPKSYEKFGTYLKDYRLYLQSKHGMEFTQLAISQKCDLSTAQYISNIERNISMPSPAIAVKLAELYSIDRKIVYRFFIDYRAKEYERSILGKEDLA